MLILPPVLRIWPLFAYGRRQRFLARIKNKINPEIIDSYTLRLPTHSGYSGNEAMFDFAIQFSLALLYANLGEWLFHKCILHGLGKKPDSIWAFHCHEHHEICTRNAMFDPGYRELSLTVWNAQTKELAVFCGALLLHLPLFWFFPAFCLGLYSSLTLYYVKHRKAHLDPLWAKQHLSWHYEHHLNPGSGNWCVTWPWFDYLLATRSKTRQADNDD